MSILFLWFGFGRDEVMLKWSVESARLAAAAAGVDARMVVVDDSAWPMTGAVVRELESVGVRYWQSHFPRGAHMNGGRDGLRGVLDVYREVFEMWPAAMYVCKVDCDTLVTGMRWLPRVRRGCFEVIGTGGMWRGFMGMFGMYLVGRRLVCDMVPTVGVEAAMTRAAEATACKLAPDWPDDQSIYQIAVALAGERSVELIRNTDFLHFWRYRQGEPLHRALDYWDCVTFGDWGLLGRTHEGVATAATAMAEAVGQLRKRDRRLCV